jgi:hypothetical protein
VNASWNVFRGNRASGADIGFSEQFENWGNQWLDNVSGGNRRYGFHFGPARSTATVETPVYAKMQCNQALNEQLGLTIGSAVQSEFSSNDFKSASVYYAYQDYWSQADNTWEGSPQLPPTSPSATNYLQNCGSEAPPAIALSTSSTAFSGTAGGASPAPKSFQVSNAGGGTLSWNVSDNAAWLSASPTSGTNTGTVTLSVNTAGLAAGTYSATVTVSSSGATSKTVAVTLTLSSASTPAIALSKSSMAFSGTIGQASPAPQSFQVSNAGGGTLSWNVSDNVAWLAANPTSGTNTGTVTLNVKTAGLPADEYWATVTVAAPGASPKTIQVYLKLTP